MSALPFRRRRGDRALPEPQPRIAPADPAPGAPLEYLPPSEQERDGGLMPEPRCPHCGSRDSLWGEPCGICAAQFEREQRVARSA